jgi:hypothetical protein
MNCANHTDVAAVAYCRTCGKALCANCTRDVQGTVYCESCLAARLNQPFTPGPGVAAPVPPQPFEGEAKPGLALVLGMIPGVGAMYNGQFVKGVVHAMIFASCIFLADHGLGPIAGFGIMIWWFYMVFDAYTTAKARKYGQPLPDPFGFNRMFSASDPHFVSTVSTHGEAVGQRMEQAVNDARQSWASRNAAANPYAPGSPEAQQYAANIANEASAAAYQPVPEPEPQTGIPTSAYVLIGIGVLFLLSTLDVFRFDLGRFWPLLLIGMGIWLLFKRRSAAGQ